MAVFHKLSGRTIIFRIAWVQYEMSDTKYCAIHRVGIMFIHKKSKPLVNFVNYLGPVSIAKQTAELKLTIQGKCSLSLPTDITELWLFLDLCNVFISFMPSFDQVLALPSMEPKKHHLMDFKTLSEDLLVLEWIAEQKPAALQPSLHFYQGITRVWTKVHAFARLPLCSYKSTLPQLNWSVIGVLA